MAFFVIMPGLSKITGPLFGLDEASRDAQDSCVIRPYQLHEDPPSVLNKYQSEEIPSFRHCLPSDNVGDITWVQGRLAECRGSRLFLHSYFFFSQFLKFKPKAAEAICRMAQCSISIELLTRATEFSYTLRRPPYKDLDSQCQTSVNSWSRIHFVSLSRALFSLGGETLISLKRRLNITFFLAFRIWNSQNTEFNSASLLCIMQTN